jgi:flagellar basal-body rod modification protein FlgD
MSGVSGVSGTSQQSTTATTSADFAVSKEADFLKLLIAKLSNQNPLDQQSQEDFLGQLAQFETLNQTVKLNNNIQSLTLAQDLGSSSNLIGKKIDLDDPSTGDKISGTVSSIRVVNGKCTVIVNSKQYDLTAITGVYDDPSGTASPIIA